MQPVAFLVQLVDADHAEQATPETKTLGQCSMASSPSSRTYWVQLKLHYCHPAAMVPAKQCTASFH